MTQLRIINLAPWTVEKGLYSYLSIICHSLYHYLSSVL